MADLNDVKILVVPPLASDYHIEMLEKPRRKRLSSYHHGDLRDALVRAARRVLEKDGLEHLSLRQVARAVGVSPAAPYHHFADKQALLSAVATQGFAALRSEMLTRAAQETDAAVRLDANGIGYVVFAVENPALFRLMFGGEKLRANPALTDARKKAYGVLEAAVTDSSPENAANPLVCLRLWALVHGIAKLIVEHCIKPSDYGLSNSEALATRLLRRGP